MTDPKPMTTEQQRDYDYHEWCRKMVPKGWTLYGTNAPAGGMTIYRDNTNVHTDIPHAILATIDALTTARRKDALAALAAEGQLMDQIKAITAKHALLVAEAEKANALIDATFRKHTDLHCMSEFDPWRVARAATDAADARRPT